MGWIAGAGRKSGSSRSQGGGQGGTKNINQSKKQGRRKKLASAPRQNSKQKQGRANQSETGKEEREAWRGGRKTKRTGRKRRGPEHWLFSGLGMGVENVLLRCSRCMGTEMRRGGARQNKHNHNNKRIQKVIGNDLD